MGPHRERLKLFIAILLPFVVTYGVLELALRGFAGGEIAFYRSIVGETPTLFAVFKNPETRIRKFQFPVNPHEPDPYLAWKNRPNLRQEPYLTTSHGIYSPHEIAYERSAGAKNYRLLSSATPPPRGLASTSSRTPGRRCCNAGSATGRNRQCRGHRLFERAGAHGAAARVLQIQARRRSALSRQ